MNIVNAINVVTARKAGTLSVFALEAVNAKLFDKVVEQANAAPTSAFVQVARATLKEKRDAGYLLSERTQELYELLCGRDHDRAPLH